MSNLDPPDFPPSDVTGTGPADFSRQREHFAALVQGGIHLDDIADLLGFKPAKAVELQHTWGWRRLRGDFFAADSITAVLRTALKAFGSNDAMRLKRHKARKAAIEADAAEGRVLSREVVDRDMLQLVHTLRRNLRGLPGTLKARCPDTSADQMQVLRDAVDRVLVATHAQLTEGWDDTAARGGTARPDAPAPARQSAPVADDALISLA